MASPGAGGPVPKAKTIRDVAAAAGVSVGTVSRALNAPDTVRRPTLELVRAAIDELGFRPDAVAQSLRRRNTLTVGFVVNDISNPLHSVIFKAAEAELHDRGYSLLLVNTGGNSRREAAAIEMLQQRRIDGVIMTINSEKDRQCLDRMQKLRVPAVLLDREIELAIDTIQTDHAGGLAQAADYLLELGHRRIGLITSGPEIRPGRERVRGFVSAFAARGLRCPRDLIRAGSLAAEFGFREALALLQGASPPTALIAGGNQILVGVLRALLQMEIAVPRDLSLITCDVTDLSSLWMGGITAIDRDLQQIGHTAAQVLLDRMAKPDERVASTRRITLPTKLVLGRSCGRPHG
jgi:LacI family transcriptional regulator